MPNLVDSYDKQILERRIAELGKMERADFVSIVLGLWNSGVPFDKKIQASPFWNTAPQQWRDSAFHFLRTESITRRKEREERINRE